jgi:hypothetical protein
MASSGDHLGPTEQGQVVTTVAEVRYYAHQLAALTVTAVRACSREQLAEVHDVLAETFEDALMLLVHDAEVQVDLARDLFEQVRSLDPSEVRA